jgi:hypothetical protein
MVRKPRLHIPGGLYHVRLRGNGGQGIFSDDEDRYHLYLLIQQGGGTIWPSGPRFLLHDEPHTLGYPGRGKSFVRVNAESVIPLHPLDEHQTGRVRMWRGGLRINLSVAAPFVWRCLNSRTITPFPHPPHRTGHADFPHPALGQKTHAFAHERSSAVHPTHRTGPCYPGVP